MKAHLAYPSLGYLVITLITGMWIRVQWLVPEWAFFTQKFAIHAHSHLAMLGWLFPAFLFLLMKSPKELTRMQKVSLGSLHVLIIAMFPAFLFEGYAFFSILFSSLYLVVSYILIWQFRTELELRTNPLKQWAVALYLLSTIGPWALGGTTTFGSEWLSAWISWFLHLQFNGWVTFAVFALFWNPASLTHHHIKAIHTIGISTVFISLGIMFPTPTTFLRITALIAGAALFLGSVSLLILYKHNHTHPSVGQFLILLLLLKTLLLGGIGLDVVQTYVHHVSQARVAFTHTTLLGIATPFLLLHLNFKHSVLLGFIACAWWMIIFLWLETFGMYVTLGLPVSIQAIYLLLGFLLLVFIIVGLSFNCNKTHAQKTHHAVLLRS